MEEASAPSTLFPTTNPFSSTSACGAIGSVLAQARRSLLRTPKPPGKALFPQRLTAGFLVIAMMTWAKICAPGWTKSMALRLLSSC